MDDLVAEGMTRAEALAQARTLAGQTPGGVRLPASERPLVRLALATVGQWRMVAGKKGVHRIAFDMTGVDVTARWLGITPDARLLDGLTIIEREALKLMRQD